MIATPLRFSVVIASACGLFTLAPCARGQSASGDRAVAQALFDEGRQLMTERRYADACPKFQESQTLDPGVGTLFQLGECNEKLGHTASAWAAFVEAADASRTAGQGDRERVARERATALEARLCRLAILAPSGAAERDIIVKRDNVAIGRGQLGTAVPVDPGPHAITAESRGKKTWSTIVTLRQEGATTTVSIPELAEAPTVSEASPSTSPIGTSAAPRSEPSATEWSTIKTAGILTTGAGVVSLLVGGAVGLAAKSKATDSKSHCPADPNLCDPTGVALRSDAVKLGNVGTVFVLAGGVVAAAGLGMWIFGPSTDGPQRGSIWISPSVGRSEGTLGLQGVW